MNNSTPELLNIVQYNVNKSRNRVMAFFRAVDPKIHHVLAVQEPWRNPQMPTSVRPANYHLFTPLRSDTRVCFYVSKVLDPEKWTVREHSPDLITLTLHLPTGPLHVHNCYNQPPKLATSKDLGVLRLLPAALAAEGQHILVGDLERLSVTRAARSKDTAGEMETANACADAKSRARHTFRLRLDGRPSRDERLRQRMQRTTSKAKTAARMREDDQWATRWQDYREKARTEHGSLTTAQRSDWSRKQHHLHKGLLKAESTVVTLLRTEQIGLNDYLCRRRVPGYDDPLCDCGWPRPTVKHILLSCPRFPRDRDKMLHGAGTSDFATMLSTPQGVRAAAKCFLGQDILAQFSLSAEMETRRKRRVGRRAGNDVPRDSTVTPGYLTGSTEMRTWAAGFLLFLSFLGEKIVAECASSLAIPLWNAANMTR